MADQEGRREPVGTVAEETARLLDALGGWAHDQGGGRGGGGRGRDGAPNAGGPGEGAREGTPPADASARHTERCEHCGSPARAGEALACQLCPFCQGIALLRSVRPETVERFADLAAAVSGVLRDIAAEQSRREPAPPPPRGQRVQDIDVDDEDDRDEHPVTDPPPTGTPSSSQESEEP